MTEELGVWDTPGHAGGVTNKQPRGGGYHAPAESLVVRASVVSIMIPEMFMSMQT
jgi:hypothetical protein